uniref:Uncharacterized protein n=3 Tax=Aplanochytrium stocchinoi TaxID=215587 RepID=A0A7S3V0H1_9STRA
MSWSPNLNSKPEFFDSDPFWQSLLDTFEQPGVAADALNYYRKNLGQGSFMVRALFPLLWWLGYLIGLLKKRPIQTSPIEESEVKRFLKRPPLKMPVLALIGENDGCFFPPLFRYVHSRDGGSERLFLNTSLCKTIQGAGHFSFIEQPEIVSQHLLELFELPSCGNSSL